jgi:nicotinamidase/pyrazinamidase
MELKTGLLVVDVQNDFLPGGKLPVEGGDEVVPVLNKYLDLFTRKRLPVFASRDWHPVQTKHFEGGGGTWPEHCVMNTKGAEFHPDLKLPRHTNVVSKGTNPEEDGYTAFQGRNPDGRLLDDLLRARSVGELLIGGLTTDHCVKWSALDAVEAGFTVKVLGDAIRAVNLEPGDEERAIEQMKAKGVELISFEQAKDLLKEKQ